MSSIWNTVEIRCWSEGYDYQEYARTHKAIDRIGAVFDEEAYCKFCELMDEQMERDIEKEDKK